MRGEVYCFAKLKQDQAKRKQELDKEKRGEGAPWGAGRGKRWLGHLSSSLHVLGREARAGAGEGLLGGVDVRARRQGQARAGGPLGQRERAREREVRLG